MTTTTLSDEQVSGGQELPSTESQEQNATDDSQNAPAEGAEKEAKEGGLESLPEEWQREVRALRSENAERRTKYNDLKAQLDEAKSQEDIDKAVAAYKEQVVELERTLALERHTRGLPKEAIELVSGETEAEIEASAQRVRALIEATSGSAQTQREPDLDAAGGLNPKATRNSFSGLNPRELARAALQVR